MRTPLIMALLLLVAFTFTKCGEAETTSDFVVLEDPGDEMEYGEEETVVITDGTIYKVTGDPGDECVEFGDQCVDLTEEKGKYCDDPEAQADLIVEDGVVVGAICYPPVSDGLPIEEVQTDDAGNPEIPQTDHGAVIVFGDNTDGKDVEGDLTLEAEQVIVFGNGIDDTIITGDLLIESNHCRVRGLTVEGNVTLSDNANYAALAFMKIYGNLEINSNNVTVMEVQVFGNVVTGGNNGELINVGAAGDWDIDPRTTCTDTYAFTDGDGDYSITESELGDALTCGDQSQKDETNEESN